MLELFSLDGFCIKVVISSVINIQFGIHVLDEHWYWPISVLTDTGQQANRNTFTDVSGNNVLSVVLHPGSMLCFIQPGHWIKYHLSFPALAQIIIHAPARTESGCSAVHPTSRMRRERD